jgi:hypothetical protein
VSVLLCWAPCVTKTGTFDPDPGGAVTTIWVEVREVTVALTPLNVTEAPGEKLEPTIVTAYPPVVNPVGGDRKVIWGGRGVKVAVTVAVDVGVKLKTGVFVLVAVTVDVEVTVGVLVTV